MAKVLIEDTTLTDIADSIRGKRGEQTTYKPSQMAGAIDGIESGYIIAAKPSNNTSGIIDTIQEIKDADFTGMTGGTYFFQNLSQVTKISVKNTGGLITGGSMFAGCPNLTEITGLDMSNISNTAFMFNGDKSLETISEVSFKNATYVAYTFQNCPSLSNETLNNILLALSNMTKYTNTKTLKQLALTQAQATTCTTLSNWSLAQAKGWTTGY